MTCAECSLVLILDGTEHLWHEPDCARFLEGQCRCARWAHADCCRECRDTPVTDLAARLRVAHNQQVTG